VRADHHQHAQHLSGPHDLATPHRCAHRLVRRLEAVRVTHGDDQHAGHRAGDAHHAARGRPDRLADPAGEVDAPVARQPGMRGRREATDDLNRPGDRRQPPRAVRRAGGRASQQHEAAAEPENEPDGEPTGQPDGEPAGRHSAAKGGHVGEPRRPPPCRASPTERIVDGAGTRPRCG